MGTHLRQLAGLTLAALALATGPATAAAADMNNPGIGNPPYDGVDTHATYQIVNNETGGSLLPEGLGGNTSNNVALLAWNDNNGGDDWKFVYRNRTNADGYRLYWIRNTSTGKCASPSPDRQYNNRTMVVQFTCDDNAAFDWWVRPRSNDPDLVQIINDSTDTAMQPWENQRDRYVVLGARASNLSWWNLTTD
ncbi:RICIN domain-containing protein [Nonomuraea sp. NPDC046802]|uniref:RICIN domain-containing protein n=1 Tax=Nonomuraea sp. NPDC046802 TaxID=3154919 RepID=UPI0033FF96C9